MNTVPFVQPGSLRYVSTRNRTRSTAIDQGDIREWNVSDGTNSCTAEFDRHTPVTELTLNLPMKNVGREMEVGTVASNARADTLAGWATHQRT